MERFEYLWLNADYSDATFYELPVSTNQSEQAQVRSTLSFVSETVPTINPNCKPFGHLWFQVKGKNQEEADIYFSEGCTYFLWYDNGKPAFANEMTEQGVAFYNNIIASVAKQAQQPQQ